MSELPDIYEDEDGGSYYSPGHVDLARFREAVIVFELTECDLSPAELSVLSPDFKPMHLYLRDLGPDHELMERCSHSDEGAQPFTVAVRD